MADQVPRARRPVQMATWVGVLGSLAIHALGYGVLSWGASLPRPDFEFTLPDQVEFGLTEASQAALPSAPATAVPERAVPEAALPEPAEAVVPAEPPGEAKKPKRKLPKPADAGIVDAAVTDASGLEETPDASTDAGPGQDSGPPDAATGLDGSGPGGGLPGPDAGQDQLAAYAPPGAQLSLRLHLGRIRSSPLAEDVRQLLAVVPDWKMILEGSGIEPLADLERLFLASPNLQRSRLVIVGEYRGKDELPRAAVARLAQARERVVQWRTQLGFPVAPWANLDSTERIVALVGPQQFAITRPEDLPRLLAVAARLAERRDGVGVDGGSPDSDSLLGLGDGQSVALDVEGARYFVRGNREAIPLRLHAGVQQLKGGGAIVEAEAYYESAERAQGAQRTFESLRDRTAAHPVVALLGLSAALRAVKLSSVDGELRLHAQLTSQQVRVLLGFVRSALTPPPPMPAPGAPPGQWVVPPTKALSP